MGCDQRTSWRRSVEQGKGERTTFTVEPHGGRALVRIETVVRARGLERLLLPLLAPFVLRPLYPAELLRLERYAQEHIPAQASGDDSGQAAAVRRAKRVPAVGSYCGRSRRVRGAAPERA